MLLVLEIAFAVLFIILGYYLALIPILIIHISVAIVLRQDPFIADILMELSSMSPAKKEKD